MCLSKVEEITQFLLRGPLAVTVRDGRLQLPHAASGSKGFCECRRVIDNGLRATITPNPIPEAQISFSEKETRIKLSAGFFCERWCSAYRLVKLSCGLHSVFDEFEVICPSMNQPFIWPDDAPFPDSSDNEIVSKTNTLYPLVIAATILHEVGHAVNRECSASKPIVELECDFFAMDYLLGTNGPKDKEIITLAVAIWLCCLCSESLLFASLTNNTHPNPVARMEQFFKYYITPFSESVEIQAFQLLCVAHVQNLARIRRPDQLEIIRTRTYKTFIARLIDLRQCWE